MSSRSKDADGGGTSRMARVSSVTQDGSVAIVHLTRYSFQAKVLYYFLMTFFFPVVSKFIASPTASGHQRRKPPRSIRKSYIVEERKFYDWTVYDISMRPSKNNNRTPEQHEGKHEESDKKPQRRVMYIPGTSFTSPASPEHFKFASVAFLDNPETTLTMVLHPLAPKHTVSKVFPRFFELYEQLSKDIAPGGRIDLAGDSSGGGLALSISQRLKDRGLMSPHYLFLMAPSVDFVQCNAGDMEEASKKDPLQTVADSHHSHLEWMGNDLDLADPIVSPLRGDFSGLKNVKVVGVNGTYDILSPDGVRLRDKLKEEGIDCQWLVGDKMLHCWPLMQAYKLPEATDAVQWISKEMK